MTDQEAQAKAIEVFGEYGLAWHGSKTEFYGQWYCIIGWKDPRGVVAERGYGATWEDAFEMASEADG